MAEALRLAKKGLMTTQPNPMVGCVLVSDNKVIARGYHQKAGLPHAEVNAIAQAKQNNVDIKGSIAYVTLEPCAHHGKTPPCCEALVSAGVATVVIAMTDPNPEVSGKGIAFLKKNDVEVIQGVLEEQALELNRAFVKSMKFGLPFVQLKIAASLDGRTAMRNGDSQWITDKRAREDVQLLRAQAGAILTGSGTFYTDNPSLTVRPEDWTLNTYTENTDELQNIRQPLRVVVSTKLPTNQATDKNIFKDGHPSIWATCQTSDHRVLPKHVSILPVASHQDDANHEGIDLHQLLIHLATEQQVRSVLIEAGASLAGQFLEAGLVDEIIMYFAPTLMGSDAREMFTLPILSMNDKLPLQIKSVRQVGETVRITAQTKTVNNASA